MLIHWVSVSEPAQPHSGCVRITTDPISRSTIHMKHRTLLCAALLIGLAGRTAQAWNSLGHMAVAYVAWQKLTPAERARVVVLLQKNPSYQQWLTYIQPEVSDPD